jgi:hypothetical protein
MARSELLFDPPFGLKVVDASGLPVLQWTMVWINGSNIVAIDAQVSDPISVGTSYAGGLLCSANGTFSTVPCSYEAPSGPYPRGRIVWNGNLVPDQDATGLPGPFVDLIKLKYGDRIVIHAYGQKYTFEVRTNEVVDPNNATVMRHEEKSWLTLVTCKEYDEKTNTYRKRQVVRAVLVSVDWE